MSTKDDLTITQKTAKLSDLVAWFDGDDFELEKALEKFKEAEKLAAEIEHDLNALENSITVVKQSFNKA